MQIYIMTYNRPDCVINAIESVRKQSFTNFTLIVSDNSTNSLTEELIRKTYIFPDFIYIKREPPVGGIEHLNLILSEVTSDFFMIFHDDDVMHMNMIESLYNKSRIAILSPFAYFKTDFLSNTASIHIRWKR